MVSWYYHCLFQAENTHASFVARARSDLRFDDYSDIRQNLPEFIDYSFSAAAQFAFYVE